ncbi:MAG: VCBS repeat-containing protein [Flavobacteriales bacterium]|nr:VCBS repeat-containing protein [Flavobacteriales bacterium]
MLEFDTAAHFLSVNDNVGSVFLDLDGDGDTDHYKPSGTVDGWYEYGIRKYDMNDGNGNFSQSANHLFPGYAYKINQATADFNGDGITDFLLNGNSNVYRLAWYDNLVSTGNILQPSNIHPIVKDTYYNTDLTTQDVDFDGDIDLVLISGVHEFELVWIENLGNNEFAKPELFPADIWQSVGRVGDYDFADMNGDNQDDLILLLGSPLSETLVMTFNTQSGLYETIYSGDNFYYDPSKPNPLLIEDWNLDGFLDMATYTTSQVKIFINDGNGDFSITDYESLSPNMGIACDVDNDGLLDILSGSLPATYPAGPTFPVKYIKNNGDGTFNTAVYLNLDVVRIRLCKDIDSDGDQDLLVLNAGNDFWMMNDGSSNFVQGVDFLGYPVSGYTSLNSVRITDVDHDGIEEFIAENYFSHNVDVELFRVQENDGVIPLFHQSFLMQHNEPNNAQPRSTALGDLTGDGFDDLITYQSERIFWRPNSAGGGCMNATICNYSPFADWDDGSCCSLCGCTDATAYNFNPAADCNDFSCLYEVTGRVFYDNNTNGSQQVGEPGLPFETLLVMPDNILVTTDDNGDFFLPLGAGTYTLSMIDDPVYPNYTTLQTQTVTISSSPAYLFFGVHNEVPVHQVNASINPYYDACNDYGIFYIDLQNLGNVIDDYDVVFTYDELITDYVLENLLIQISTIKYF